MSKNLVEHVRHGSQSGPHICVRKI